MSERSCGPADGNASTRAASTVGDDQQPLRAAAPSPAQQNVDVSFAQRLDRRPVQRPLGADHIGPRIEPLVVGGGHRTHPTTKRATSANARARSTSGSTHESSHCGKPHRVVVHLAVRRRPLIGYEYALRGLGHAHLPASARATCSIDLRFYIRGFLLVARAANSDVPRTLHYSDVGRCCDPWRHVGVGWRHGKHARNTTGAARPPKCLVIRGRTQPVATLLSVQVSIERRLHGCRGAVP